MAQDYVMAVNERTGKRLKHNVRSNIYLNAVDTFLLFLLKWLFASKEAIHASQPNEGCRCIYDYTFSESAVVWH